LGLSEQGIKRTKGIIPIRW